MERTHGLSKHLEQDSIVEETVMTFYIIRHGQTEANRKHIMQGHSDGKLTKLGVNQVSTYLPNFANFQ